MEVASSLELFCLASELQPQRLILSSQILTMNFFVLGLSSSCLLFDGCHGCFPLHSLTRPHHEAQHRYAKKSPLDIFILGDWVSVPVVHGLCVSQLLFSSFPATHLQSGNGYPQKSPLKTFLSWISFLLVCSLLCATTTSLFLPSSSS